MFQILFQSNVYTINIDNISPCSSTIGNKLHFMKNKLAVLRLHSLLQSATWNDCWHSFSPAQKLPLKKQKLAPQIKKKKKTLFYLPPLLWAFFFFFIYIFLKQVTVLSKTICTDNDLQSFNIFNPSSVFHPELPVIPKPGEFKRLFIWKKTAYETQQKANNHLHFNLTACFFTFHSEL